MDEEEIIFLEEPELCIKCHRDIWPAGFGNRWMDIEDPDKRYICDRTASVYTEQGAHVPAEPLIKYAVRLKKREHERR